MLQYNPTVSGSLNITGSLQVSGDISGTINGINITGLSQSVSSQLGTLQSSTGSSDTKWTTLGGVTSSALTRLTNIETKSASVDISLSNINSITASNIARLSNLETKSASVDISITNINSFTASNGVSSVNSYTASNDTKFTTLASYTGSNDTKWTSISNITSSLIAATGSYATTGSNTFKGTTIISGSTYIQGDLVVYGSSSIQYISASSVSIGTNIVQLNTNQPAVRFAGITIQDSGSAQGVTGSIFWDGLCNGWIYSNPSGVGYSGGMLMSGPRNTGSIGNEVGLTCNYIAKSGGGDHLYDSCIIDDGTTVCINANLKGSGTACFAGTVCTPTIQSANVCTDGSYGSRVVAYGSNVGMFVNSTGAGEGYYRILNGACSIGALAATGWYKGSAEQNMGIITGPSKSFQIATNDCANARLTIGADGISVFACQVCTTGLYSTAAIGINSYNSAIPLQIKRWVGSSGTALLIGNDNVVGMPALSFCNDNGGGTAYVSMTSNCQININGSIYACPSGYVGIGTSSPTVDLSVKPGVDNAAIRVGTWAIMENVTTNQTMFGYNTAYATGLGTGWRYINNGYAMGIRMHDAYGSGDIMFHLTACGTGGTNLGGTWDGTDLRMIIKNDGKVGIGTITPVSSLHVVCVPSSYYGIIETTGCSTGTVKHFRVHKPGCVEYGIGILDTNSFHISTASTFPTTNGFTLTSGGNVGIGTSCSNIKLYVNQPSAQGTSTPALRVSYIGAGDGNPQNVAMFTNDATLATSGYIYIGSYSGSDWYIGKNVAGSSGNTNFQLGISTNNILGTLTTGGAWSTTGGGTSDRRVKKDIIPISQNALSFINELNPVSFKFKEDCAEKTRRGFIAQDVLETSIPGLVLGDGDQEGGTYGLDYDGILSLAVKAIQEQQCTINLLKSCIGIS